LRSRARHSLQPAARPGLPVDRLRTLHARGQAGRGRARRPLVVGTGRQEGVRLARAAARDIASGGRHVTARNPSGNAHRNAQMHGTMPTAELIRERVAEAERAPIRLAHLAELEAESIYIIREAVAESDNPVML